MTQEEIYSRAKQVDGLEGMTVNERLFASGLLSEFNKAIKKDKMVATNILRALKVDEASIKKLLSNIS